MSSISIITASYQAAKTIAQTLQSVAEQGIEDLEHWVIDGGSQDGTLEIVQQYPVRYISEPDQGIYDAMNKGIQRAQGEIIGILNADDFYPHDRILKQVIAAFNHPQVEACYGDLKYIDQHGQTVRYWRAGQFKPEKFYWGWMPPHPTFFVRRSVYERFGLFNLALGSAADYEIMLRFLCKHRIQTVYIPQVLVHMRVGGISNASLKNRWQAHRMDKLAWQVNGLKPYPWTIMMKPLRKIHQWWIKS